MNIELPTLNIEAKRKEEVQMLLGRQVRTSFGEIIDLLVHAPDGLRLAPGKRQSRLPQSKIQDFSYETQI